MKRDTDVLWLNPEGIEDTKVKLGIGTDSPSAHPRYPWMFAVAITSAAYIEEFIVTYGPLSWEVQPKEAVMESKQDKCGVHDLAINGGAKCILEPGHSGDHKNIYGTFSMEFKKEVVDATKQFLLPGKCTTEEIMGAVRVGKPAGMDMAEEDKKRAEKMSQSGGFAYGPTNDSRFTAEMVLQHMVSGDFLPLIQECERLGIEVQEMKRFLGMTTKSGDDGAVWFQLSLKKSN